jgi:hypothetical protein
VIRTKLNPHARYGARQVWMATLVVSLVAWRALLPDRKSG